MEKKAINRKKRHGRVRKRIQGTAERPRLTVFRSLKNISIQVVDDVKSQTICSFSTQGKSFAKESDKMNKVARAEKLGQISAEEIKKKGIKKIAFDRGGYKYHGRVKAVAGSLRKAGIEF